MWRLEREMRRFKGKRREREMKKYDGIRRRIQNTEIWKNGRTKSSTWRDKFLKHILNPKSKFQWEFGKTS